jgi:hypothetical protein
VPPSPPISADLHFLTTRFTHFAVHAATLTVALSEENPLNGARIGPRSTLRPRNQPLTNQECGQGRYAPRGALGLPVRPEGFEGLDGLRDRRNAENAPPVGVLKFRWESLPPSAEDCSPRCGFFVRPVSSIQPLACMVAIAAAAAFSPVLRAPTARSRRWTWRTVRKMQSSPSSAGWRFCRQRQTICQESASTASCSSRLSLLHSLCVTMPAVRLTCPSLRFGGARATPRPPALGSAWATCPRRP